MAAVEFDHVANLAALRVRLLLLVPSPPASPPASTPDGVVVAVSRVLDWVGFCSATARFRAGAPAAGEFPRGPEAAELRRRGYVLADLARDLPVDAPVGLAVELRALAVATVRAGAGLPAVEPLPSGP